VIEFTGVRLTIAPQCSFMSIVSRPPRPLGPKQKLTPGVAPVDRVLIVVHQVLAELVVQVVRAVEAILVG
jgi:hypothetical protein